MKSAGLKETLVLPPLVGQLGRFLHLDRHPAVLSAVSPAALCVLCSVGSGEISSDVKVQDMRLLPSGAWCSFSG